MKDKSSQTTIDQQIELAIRLIERYDQLLSSLESRAATVVSADALLLAGTTFLLDKVWSQASQYSSIKQIAIGVSLSFALVTLALSIVYATTSIANVWRTTQKIVGGNLLPPSLFFRPSDTVNQFKEFSQFEKHFKSSNREQTLTYALSELWLVSNLNIRRYRYFQQAVRLLVFSVVPFLIAYALLIIK
jgi:hypothetical protein